MELSGRIFGFNSWSMLVPQALEGVAAVALLYATVKRVSGYGAATLAAAAFAITPVAVLMFRFNNPDALLVLLLVASGYCVTRALENASTRWLVGAGLLVGLGFITKLGQALLVVPAFGLVLSDRRSHQLQAPHRAVARQRSRCRRRSRLVGRRSCADPGG